MALYIYWFVMALALLGLEMVTGTFYILVLAIAVAIGGVAALLGLSQPMQITLAALAGIVGIVVLLRIKSTRPIDMVSQSLDTGQPVKLISWREDGSARVYYRGSEWDAEPESADMPRAGTFYIKAIRGSKLVLTQQKTQQQ